MHPLNNRALMVKLLFIRSRLSDTAAEGFFFFANLTTNSKLKIFLEQFAESEQDTAES